MITSKADTPPSFNPTQADAANAGLGNYLKDFGPYVGQIIGAEHVVSAKQNEGVSLRFQMKDGRQSPLLKLWCKTPTGTELPGWGHLGAIKFLAGVNEELIPQRGTVKRWAESAGKTVDQMGWIFPQLVGTWCGFYLKHSLWDNPRSGKTERKLEIEVAFSPKTGQTFKELQEQKPAAYVSQIFNLEKANPIPDPALLNGSNNQNSPHQANNNAMASSAGFQSPVEDAAAQAQHQPAATAANGAPAYNPEFDDDIPF